MLGNCTKSYGFLKFVNEISPNVAIVRGEFDNGQLPTTKKKRTKEEIPMNTVIKQGEFKIGCCSGYTLVPKNDPLSLLALARQLDVDIMLWGGTHNVEAYTLEGKFFVNPGSCTGAFNTDWPIIGEDETVAKKLPVKHEIKKEVRVEEDAEQKEDITPSTEENADTVKEAKEGKNVSENESNFEISELDIEGSNVPSFCLLDIQGSTCTLYIYIYVDGEVKVDRVVYKKED